MLPDSAARWRVAMLGLLAALLMVAGRPTWAQEAPDALVKRVSQDVLATIKADPLIQAGNEARIREVVEAKLLPNFDFMRMTALAMGKNWRSATPEQQKRLAEEFKSLLVRTYSGALNQYRNETIDYKPLRANPGDTDVTSHRVLKRRHAGPGRRAKKTDAGKHDVVVGGVSLVANYRDEFNGEIGKGGTTG
jgi:phospholipid transport system substrate-binding protein